VTLFDYIVLAIVASSVIIGLVRGLIKEVISLLGWVVAYVAANAFGPQFAPLLPAVIPGDAARLIVAFIVLFIAVRLLMGLVGMAIGALITATGLTLADRALGACFGVARALLIVVAVGTLCSMTTLPQQPFWREARLRGAVEASAHAVKPYLPEALARHVRM
jgi:membrane protein required for colicin V production